MRDIRGLPGFPGPNQLIPIDMGSVNGQGATNLERTVMVDSKNAGQTTGGLARGLVAIETGTILLVPLTSICINIYHSYLPKFYDT